MPPLSLPQHLFSSVTQGLFKDRGRGFQTVACTPELRDTADLRALEEASFFAVTAERRSERRLPVKELCYRLPSGRFAVGRMQDAGIDSLGRDGNYVAHQLVLTEAEMLAVGWQPFNLLDITPWGSAPDDLSPRLLEPLTLVPGTITSLQQCASGVDGALLGRAAAMLFEAGPRTLLLVGDEARSRPVIRALYAALPTRERRDLTFCTHFFEGNPYQELFKVASVGSRGEAPAAGDTEQYRVLDLERGGSPPTSRFGQWLETSLGQGRWEEVNAVHALLDGLRDGKSVPETSYPEPLSGWTGAVYEQEADQLAKTLVGKPGLLTGVASVLPQREDLAQRLFRDYPPSALCGNNSAIAPRAVAALRTAAKPKHWLGWLKKHREDPLLRPYLGELDPAWKKLAARLPWPKR